MPGTTAATNGLNVSVKSVITDLASKLSSNAKIVTEQGEEWRMLMERWSDLDIQIPAAIVAVATEADVVETVKLCLAHGVKFVPKAGGHSPWSTIGAEGVIIDLTAFNAVSIDKEASTVTVSGGTQIKDAVAALFAAGLCSPFGTANTVGSIPQAINGGLTILSGILGQTSDAILSARVVTATGTLVTVSSTQHPDLLYAIKGAGQHFGLVTSLTLQASPHSVLGSSDATIWKTAAIFPAARIAEIIRTFAPLANDPNPRAAASTVVTKDPKGSGATIVVCALTYFGSSEAGNAHFATIKALGPFVWAERRVSYANINDDFDPFCRNGGFKKHIAFGLTRVLDDPAIWEREVKAYEVMIERCGAGAGYSMVSMMYVGKAEKGRFVESAHGHRDVVAWFERVSWTEDEGSLVELQKWDAQAVEIATGAFAKGELTTYQNSSRVWPIESRFPGVERLKKLRALKREWDPKGVFTDALL